MTADADTTLILTRTMQAGPDALWRCWTTPDLMKRWFAPHPVAVTEVQIDPTPGGIFRTVMVVPDHGTMDPGPGCILVADPARRLVWTNALGPGFRPARLGTGPMDFTFTADIRLTPDGPGTIYCATVTHATAAAAQAHAAMGFHDGWGTVATQLDAVAGTV